ncbi:MAG: hypothetical protein JWO58_2196, partial [Chitinophagaceae bacterium]|nr:hypothetical protein [Chitinophagaceae bacterium]
MMIFNDRLMILTGLKSIQKTKMKTLASILMLVLAFSGNVFSQCTQLVWQDEFNTTSLDLTKWNYVTGNGCSGSSGCGFGNNELEYYTSGTNNITVNGSNLVITPKYQANYAGSSSNYTSGKITTQGLASWLYGRMEASIKVPSGPGMWPAFWMLSDANNWPYSGEIDIEETANSNPVNAYQTLHYNVGGSYNPQQTGVTVTNANWSSAYHLYAVDWTPNQIKYSIDGVTTATYTPASLVGGTSTTWPFGSTNFYLILNLALGGGFTGNTNPGTGTLPAMYVDYVRVYSNPSSLVISGQQTVFVGDQKYYGITNAGTSATYNWVLPSGATIVSGSGTNNILVNFGSAVSGNIVCNVDGDGSGTACTSVAYNYAVKAIVKTCGIILDDFESNRNLGGQYSNGVLTVVANPSASGSNTSSTVGRYARDVGSTYDILGYTNFLVDNADDFRTGQRYFTMDVYSNAPANTPITIEFDNSVQMVNAYPDGRHSQYTAVTGPSNTWTKLTFAFSQSPDGALTAADVDRLQILFNPNTNISGQVFYFDNFTAQGKAPVTSAISGSATGCLSQTNVSYSVTATSGSTYAWTVPSGASIVSGNGTNAIVVNFGTTSGAVTVTETNAAKCTGTLVSKTVTISGPCVLTADFSATPLSTCAGNTIVFTNTTTGASGGETYAWDFGSGATPATSASSSPVSVTYSTGGSKTVSLTVTNGGGPNTNTKTNYITIANPPTTCLYSDDFLDGVVNFNTTSPSFTHTESAGARHITTSGNGEWDNFIHTINNGTVATPLNFSCAANKPILKIRVKASGSCLLRVTLLDNTGKAIDNIAATDLALTTAYQTFTIDFSSRFRNYNGGTPGPLDSTNITQVQFYINPGFASYPIGPYTSSFIGTVDIDWEGIGNNCSAPSTAPTITSFTPACGAASTSVTITGTNLTGATNVSFNGTAGSITSNTATQIVVTAPAGVTAGAITITTPGGTVTSSTNFTLTVAPSVSIAASPSGAICAGTSVTFTPTPTNGGTTPTYQWKVNGVNTTTGATYTTTTLTNGQSVTAVITSNATCISTTTATSAAVVMTVNTSVTPSVS